VKARKKTRKEETDKIRTSRGLLGCDVVAYQRFGEACCLPLQGYFRLAPKDGGNTVPWNVHILPHKYSASRSRRPRVESSWPWKPQALHHRVT